MRRERARHTELTGLDIPRLCFERAFACFDLGQRDIPSKTLAQFIASISIIPVTTRLD